MQEEIIYIPVHITKPIPQETPAKLIWNALVRISQTAKNRLLAGILTKFGNHLTDGQKNVKLIIS